MPNAGEDEKVRLSGGGGARVSILEMFAPVSQSVSVDEENCERSKVQ